MLQYIRCKTPGLGIYGRRGRKQMQFHVRAALFLNQNHCVPPDV